MSSAGTDEGGTDRLRLLVERVVARVGGLRATRTLLGVLEAYDRAGGGLTASGLAYTSLIALLPGLLLMVSIFGLLIDDPETQEQLVSAVAEAVPPLEDFARAAFESVSAGAVPTGHHRRWWACCGDPAGSTRRWTTRSRGSSSTAASGTRSSGRSAGVIVTFLLVAVPLGGARR